MSKFSLSPTIKMSKLILEKQYVQGYSLQFEDHCIYDRNPSKLWCQWTLFWEQRSIYYNICPEPH